MERSYDDSIRYTVSDLKKGMWVTESQLSNIKDYYILLVNVELLPDRNYEAAGEILLTGDKLPDNTLELCKGRNLIATIYNDSTEEGIEYDE